MYMISLDMLDNVTLSLRDAKRCIVNSFTTSCILYTLSSLFFDTVRMHIVSYWVDLYHIFVLVNGHYNVRVK